MLTNVVLDPESPKPKRMHFQKLVTITDRSKYGQVRSVSARADTSNMSLSFLGDIFPSLERLRLDYSKFEFLRELRADIPRLRFLSLEHCGLKSLDGISTIAQNVRELSVAFNEIDTFSELIGLSALRVLNVEGNMLRAVGDVELLAVLPKLKSLIVRGNWEQAEYRDDVARMLPKLRILDEIPFEDRAKKKKRKASAPPAPVEAPPQPSPPPPRPATVSEQPSRDKPIWHNKATILL